jgi:pimeloyl-ACP methyl ester carboxylesterase
VIAGLLFLQLLALEPRSATVNGVNLHYVDWGGRGSAVLFLTALGGSAEDFDPLAKGLRDRHRVLGLTRRKQPPFDNATLVEDVRAFLDSLRISKAILIGYSLAGNELTGFAIRYPKRVDKLVYLDAAYDLARNTELGRKGGIPPYLSGDAAMDELIARSDEYRPDYRGIRAPALGIFVTYDEPPRAPRLDAAMQAKLLQWWFDYGKAYRREQIEKFQSEMKRRRVVELRGTTHAGFVFEPAQQKILIREMRRFFRD